jgi:superfamily II DNA or RNA helicase
MFNLRDYQNKAIQDLDTRFKELWCKDESCYEFNFISPTGSGKTIMLAEFIRTLKTNLLMQDELCFI